MCIRSFIRGSAALGKSFGLAVLIPGREKYKTMLNLVQAIEGKLPHTCRTTTPLLDDVAPVGRGSSCGRRNISECLDTGITCLCLKK